MLRLKSAHRIIKTVEIFGMMRNAGKAIKDIMKPLLKKADIILFGLLIAIAAAGIILLSGAGTAGETAIVRQDGKTVRQISLSVDQTFRVGNVVFEVKDGAIAFIESTCPGKECIHSGWQRRPGSSAACLPNHISVTVTGQSEVDTVAE